MGTTGLPTIFINDPAETPDAEKFNDNFSFLNLVQTNLVKNGDFEQSFTGGIPDFWSLTGAGAASAQDSDSKRAANSVKVTFGSAVATLKQSSDEFKFLQGNKVKTWCFVKSSFTNQARIVVSDGVGSTASAFHTGGGAYELLVVEHTVAGAATELTLELRVESSGSALFDVAVLVDFNEVRGFIPHVEDVKAVLGTVVPTGAYLPFAGTAIPTGFLECNGAEVSRTTFSALFAAISTNWGSGDGSTTFNLPDLRGVFPRGHVGLSDKSFAPTDVNTATEEITITGHGFNRSGVPVRFSTTGTLPSPLAVDTDFFVIFVDANTIKVASTRANAIAGTAIDLTTQGTGTHTITQRLDPDASSRDAMAPGGNTGDNVGARQDDEFKSHVHGVEQPIGGADVQVAGPRLSHDPGFTDPVGGSETRPQNANVKYIIKT